MEHCTGKVKTVSYWTQDRKIRAAADKFFNDRENHDGPENVEAYQPKQDNTECDNIVVPVVHADVMTEEMRIQDIAHLCSMRQMILITTQVTPRRIQNQSKMMHRIVRQAS